MFRTSVYSVGCAADACFITYDTECWCPQALVSLCMNRGVDTLAFTVFDREAYAKGASCPDKAAMWKLLRADKFVVEVGDRGKAKAWMTSQKTSNTHDSSLACFGVLAKASDRVRSGERPGGSCLWKSIVGVRSFSHNVGGKAP